MDPKRTAYETLVALIAQDEANAALEEVTAMSDEEIARELETAGIDIEQEKARARERLELHGLLPRRVPPARRS
jgi:F0F1-type ATP synthase membrane subunit b/b'